MRSFHAALKRTQMVHLWFKAIDPSRPARLEMTSRDRILHAWEIKDTAGFHFNQFQVAESGAFEFFFDETLTAVSLLYSFEPDNVAAEGIKIHWTSDDNTLAHPAGYHFRPPFGWMNDPNGFCRIGDLYHLFYQHYPHRRRWNNMHWGHAVSTDMINWSHQPIFLQPQGALAQTEDAKGGAYSGTVLAASGAMYAFFTDHVSDRVPEVERQLRATSLDSLAAADIRIVIAERPDDLDETVDFRDPFVFTGPDGRLKMLLGTQTRGCGTVLLYETADPLGGSGWASKGSLHVFDRFPRATAECPCLVPLAVTRDRAEQRWALIIGLKQSRDPATRRKNLSIVAIGGFDGARFTPELEQELDYGTDAYAFQAFAAEDGPYGIGWLANWTDINRKVDCETTMTLPRKLVWDGEALRTPPVDAVELLRRNSLDGTALAAGDAVDLPGGQAEITCDFVAFGTRFVIEFEHPALGLAIEGDGDNLILHLRLPGKTETPRYVAIGARPSRIRIFLDLGSIEVYADDGRWTLTKRLPSFEPVRRLRLVVVAEALRHAAIWRLGRS